MSREDGEITVATIAVFTMDDSGVGGRGSVCVFGEKSSLAEASAGLEAVSRVCGPGEPRVRVRGS